MGRYITEFIYYENKEWLPEDLISWGFACAHRHSDVTIEIAAHIFNAALVNNDEELANAGRELMSIAGSPCKFTANYSAKQATANYNRPSDPQTANIPPQFKEKSEAEEDWDSSRDGIFKKKINPQRLKEAIEGVESEKVSGRPYYFVLFKILKILKYIPMNTTPRDFLLWVNLHFNCGWSENPNKRHLLNFRLEGTIKQLSRKHPSEWKDSDSWGDIGSNYYKLAISFKNAFTQTMVNGQPVDNSESFEHIKDRPQLLRDAQWYFDRFLVPDGAYINNGK